MPVGNTVERIVSMRNIYMTIGDVSKIYGISKQTILYYEKLGLFLPAKIEDNGYRYYTLEECYRLEIILTLKKLNLSLKDIQDYVEHRGPSMLKTLLEDARYGFDREINDLYTNKMNLERTLFNLERYLKIPKNRLFFGMKEESFYALTPYDATEKGKKKLFTLLEHQARLIEEVPFKAIQIGMAIDGEDYEQGDIIKYSHYCTDVGFDYEGDMEIVTRPRGMYLEMFYTGLYEEQAQWMYDKVSSYLSYEGLQIAGSVYIEPVRNYWTEIKREDYLSKIIVPVEE